MGMKVGFRISLITVEPVVFFCAASFTLNLVCFPQLLLDNICSRTYSNATKCAAMETGSFQAEYEDIQQQSAMWLSASLGLETAIILFTLPTVGAISDVIGTRAALFSSPILLILQNAFLIAIVSSGLAFPTWLLILPDIIPALFGGWSSVYVFANSYITHITSEEERSMRMTLIEAVVVLAMFAAEMVSGFIIERFGYIGAFVLNIILQVLSFLYVVFILKPVAKFNESKANQKQGGISGERETPITGLTVGGVSETEGRSALQIDSQTDNVTFAVDVKSEEENLISTDTIPSKHSIVSRNLLASATATEETESFDDAIISEQENLISNDAIPSKSDFESEKRGLASLTAAPKPDSFADDVKSSEIEDKERLIARDTDTILSKNHSSSEKMTYQALSTPQKQEECAGGVKSSDTTGKDKEDFISVIDGDKVIESSKVPSLVTPENQEPVFDDITSLDNQKEGLILIPDTDVIASKDKKMSKTEIRKVLNPLTNVKAMISAVKKLKHKKVSLLLLLALFLCTFAYIGEMNIAIFYIKSKPFYMSPRNVGFYLAYQSALLGVLGLVVFNWLLQRVFKMRDTTLLVLSCVAGIPYEILVGVATSAVMLYGIQILLAVLVLNIPTIRSFISKMAEPESVGTVMGALSMIESLAALISGIATPMAYAALLPLHRGAAYFMLAAALFVTLVISLISAHSFSKSPTQAKQAEDDV